MKTGELQKSYTNWSVRLLLSTCPEADEPRRERSIAGPAFVAYLVLKSVAEDMRGKRRYEPLPAES